MLLRTSDTHSVMVATANSPSDTQSKIINGIVRAMTAMTPAHTPKMSVSSRKTPSVERPPLSAMWGFRGLRGVVCCFIFFSEGWNICSRQKRSGCKYRFGAKTGVFRAVSGMLSVTARNSPACQSKPKTRAVASHEPGLLTFIRPFDIPFFDGFAFVEGFFASCQCNFRLDKPPFTEKQPVYHDAHPPNLQGST